MNLPAIYYPDHVSQGSWCNSLGQDKAGPSSSLDFKRTSTGILSNRRPISGTQASASSSTSGTSTPDASSQLPRLSLMAAAKREAAKRGLYSRFFRGPVLGPETVMEPTMKVEAEPAIVASVAVDRSVTVIGKVEGAVEEVKVRQKKRKRADVGEANKVDAGRERARRKEGKLEKRALSKEGRREEKARRKEEKRRKMGEDQSVRSRHSEDEEETLHAASASEGAVIVNDDAVSLLKTKHRRKEMSSPADLAHDREKALEKEKRRAERAARKKAKADAQREVEGEQGPVRKKKRNKS
jgi:hypothetical protein